MRAIAFVMLLLGSARAEEPPAWLRPDTDVKKDLRERAFVAKAAKITLGPGQLPQGAVEPDEDEVVVIEAPASGPVRVLYQDRLVRLAYYVEPSALAPVARDGAVIVATKDKNEIGPTTPAVRLRAGTRVGLDARGVVTYRDDDNKVTGRGHVAEGAVGRTFAPGAAPASRSDGERVAVRAHARLLDAPRGKQLAVLGKRPLRATKIEAHDGHTLVELELDPAVFVAWVPDAQLTTSEGGMRGRSLIAPRIGIPGIARSDAADAVAIKKGDLLHADPDGPAMAVVLNDSRLAPAPGAPAGWTRLKVPTALGPLSLYKRTKD
jgi:hypothetical protein